MKQEQCSSSVTNSQVQLTSSWLPSLAVAFTNLSFAQNLSGFDVAALASVRMHRHSSSTVELAAGFVFHRHLPRLVRVITNQPYLSWPHFIVQGCLLGPCKSQVTMPAAEACGEERTTKGCMDASCLSESYSDSARTTPPPVPKLHRPCTSTNALARI